jgi:hypothetical protein
MYNINQRSTSKCECERDVDNPEIDNHDVFFITWFTHGILGDRPPLLKRRFLVPWRSTQLITRNKSSQQFYIISYNLIDIDDHHRLLASSLCIPDVSIAYGEIIYGTNMGHDDVTRKLEVMMTYGQGYDAHDNADV